MAYGSALSAAEDAPGTRKARGAFFTPPELARFVARWAIRFPGDRVLEPACGEAEFLVAASDRLRSLGCKSAVAERNVVGCEVHEASAEKAVGRLGALGCSANIVVSDFLRLAPDPSFDVVIGNPPYVRFCRKLALVPLDALRAPLSFLPEARRTPRSGSSRRTAHGELCGPFAVLPHGVVFVGASGNI